MRRVQGLLAFAAAITVMVGTDSLVVQAVENSQAKLYEFVESYCIECHLEDDPSGEREFESLDLASLDSDTQFAVQEMIDQLTLGSMPPVDASQPSVEERLDAIEVMTAELAVMRSKSNSTGGRTILRRLSRREYRNTVRDLLGIDMTMFDPTLEFPADNLAGNFDNVGDALVTSGHLLERYLGAADQCIEKALEATSPPQVQSWHFKDKFVQQAELNAAHRRAFRNRFICLYDHPLSDMPEGAYGHVAEFKDGVHADGVYEIRVLAKAMHRDSPYELKALRIDLAEPFRLGIRPGDTAINDMVHVQPIQPLLAEQNVEPGDFQWYTFNVRLDRGFAPRFTFENGIHDFRGSIGRIYRMNRNLLPPSIQGEQGIFTQRIALIDQGQVPHIRIDEVKIRGPVDYPWPSPSHQAVLGTKSFDGEHAPELIERFASRAFRRQPTDEEVRDLSGFYEQQIEAGREPIDAYKDTLKAILCSPLFLYFQTVEQDAAPSVKQSVLAERLAYMLTSTTPDERLRRLADSGRLSDRDVLIGEVRRLLSSRASEAFAADFLDSWLNLRALGSMPPDPNQFAQYYSGDLQLDMKTETRLFLQDLIRRNAPLTEWLSAKHSFINRDLAKLYQVEDEFPSDDPTSFRRFEFLDNDRGGLLGQASVLTVSANGIETSPVVRGVWLLENVLGTPPPPPPDDVPEIDPDTRGTKTIRDQLTKHRESETCYQCHRKIDPPGFALECFDAIGQTRRFYDKRRRLQVDTSGELPGGLAFDGPSEFKQHLLSRKEFFVRTFTERLITHALGRPVEATDRAEVDAIIQEVASRGYPTRELIESVVLSEMFGR
ncbi:hypothetical protein Pla22_28560 [Rubripirellula amarantea]|uniref:Planctomycete cytochrome C n=1 Tax=Rubripirellula amarantea TaxID=2527999 RepID=A0A5C5WYP4_9BACT|nr:DUF1592 domain-containing protein [Rubripirellula amarantea]TWT55201.1 hypothetical protein Pla22_28560 [Rubripirellula amarantea]